MEPPKGDSKVKPDQKATQILLRSLERLTPGPQPPSPCNKTNFNRRKKEIENNPKITNWLLKNEPKRKKPAEKYKPLDVNVKKRDGIGDLSQMQKNNPSGKKSDKSLAKKASIEEYGVTLPSIEKIRADQKKFDLHKDSVKKLEIFDDELLDQHYANDCLEEAAKFTDELLDCKHLSKSDLKSFLVKYLDSLKAIQEGKKYSERHQLFYETQNKACDMFDENDLRCCPSLMLFSQDQKEYLLDLLMSKFGKNRCTNYFFQVLLPELCLYIFQEVHNMSKDEADLYLKKRPLC